MSAPASSPTTSSRSISARRPFRLNGDSGDVYIADALIIATGAQARWLDLPSEQKFKGFGVSACATCDGFFYRDKEVLVIGGGNTAVEEALFLTNFATKVTVVHRRDSFRAERILQERLFKQSEDLGALGHRARTTCVGDRKSRSRSRASCCATSRPASVTEHAGRRRLRRHRPRAGHRAVRRPARDEAVRLHQDRADSTATSMPGVFAAGDVTDDVYRQAVTAAGLGCMAALEAERSSPRMAKRSRASRRRNDVHPCPKREGESVTMDWDKLKVFHAAAEAGSFTHAGEQLGLSQSAVSRQVSALEEELGGLAVPPPCARPDPDRAGRAALSHRARRVHEAEAARAKLTDSRERPNGDLRVTTTPGIGVHWLTPRLGEFLDLYPDIHITLMTTDEELDLAMREADVAIRLRQPTQPDLIQRKLFSVHFHAYASPEYLKRFGTPRTLDDLDSHRIMVLGGDTCRPTCRHRNWLVEVGARRQRPAHAAPRHQQHARHAARLPARHRHRDAAGLSGRGKRRPGATVRREPTPSRSTPISSIRKNSRRSRACRRSAISSSPRRSAGISEARHSVA